MERLGRSQGADSSALWHALAARRGKDADAEAERLILLASALERLDARDSAAVSYERAADLLPLVSDWLLIRAAAVTDDSAGRARLYALVGARPARERIVWSEAAAHERTGDLDGAAAPARCAATRTHSCRLRRQPARHP